MIQVTFETRQLIYFCVTGDNFKIFLSCQRKYRIKIIHQEATEPKEKLKHYIASLNVGAHCLKLIYETCLLLFFVQLCSSPTSRAFKITYEYLKKF